LFAVEPTAAPQQPERQVGTGEDVDAGGTSVTDVAGSHDDDDGLDVDGAAQRRGENVGRAAGLEGGLGRVLRGLSVDQHLGTARGDFRPTVMLGVDRDDTAGTDQEVVDVCSAAAYRDRMQHSPPEQAHNPHRTSDFALSLVTSVPR